MELICILHLHTEARLVVKIDDSVSVMRHVQYYFLSIYRALSLQVNKTPLRPLDLSKMNCGPDFTPSFANLGRQPVGGRGQVCHFTNHSLKTTCRVTRIELKSGLLHTFHFLFPVCLTNYLFIFCFSLLSFLSRPSVYLAQDARVNLGPVKS